jgi:toxin ParE1/3/4
MAEKSIIRYLSTSQRDLIEIFDYIARDNRTAAENLLNEFDKCVSTLSTHPQIGKIPRDTVLKSKGYRYLIIGNYLIFYIFKENTVVIHRVLHSKRDYRDIL